MKNRSFDYTFWVVPTIEQNSTIYVNKISVSETLQTEQSSNTITVGAELREMFQNSLATSLRKYKHSV